MNKFNLESAKFVSILILICFIFIMVIWHAFNYLPDKNTDKLPFDSQFSDEIKKPTEEGSKDPLESDSEESAKKTLNEDGENKRKEENEENFIYKEPSAPKFEFIQDNNFLKNEISEEEDTSVENVMKRAKDFSQKNQILSAITEYQKAISLTEDNKIKAQCYEEIALAYAISKRYGSALSVAQKAYNINPSTSREMLLARLYYKTGNIDKATDRINNILRRDFLPNDR